MRVFISAGEPSGDHHAALLVQALVSRRPDIECVGLGGPQLEAAGCELVADMTRLAVMWFLRVILNIHRFVDLARRAERSFLAARPDVCVLVDFPGFHWWLAWRAKRHGIPTVFYCPPQVWAWGSWRVKKMRRLIDHVLAPLPFEHEWFSAQGLASTLVGHPFFDDLDGLARRPAAASGPPLLLLLPGSRGQEIDGNLASLLRAATLVKRQVPAARCVIAALHERHARRAAAILAADPGFRELDAEIVAGRTRELIGRATVAAAVSGSVSLELLAARVPAVIVYRISGLAHVVQSWFRHAKFITLVNLLAAREPIGPIRPTLLPPRDVPPADPEAIYPEFLAVDDPAERVAEQLVAWLVDPEARSGVVERLEAVAREVARPGSAARAAEAVLAISAPATRAADPAARYAA